MLRWCSYAGNLAGILADFKLIASQGPAATLSESVRAWGGWDSESSGEKKGDGGELHFERFRRKDCLVGKWVWMESEEEMKAEADEDDVYSKLMRA